MNYHEMLLKNILLEEDKPKQSSYWSSLTSKEQEKILTGGEVPKLFRTYENVRKNEKDPKEREKKLEILKKQIKAAKIANKHDAELKYKKEKNKKSKRNAAIGLAAGGAALTAGGIALHKWVNSNSLDEAYDIYGQGYYDALCMLEDYNKY